MNPQFWRDKKVLITGHTGFKGSWMCLWLQNLGACVYGYSLPPPTKPSLFEIARVADGMNTEDGDVRDFEMLRACMAKHKPDIIFHLAAQSLVRYSYAHPIETYTTNVIGTVNVLEAVRQSPSARVVVNVTSDKCYENRELDRGYHEADPMGGHDPYSSSKGCAELVTAAYRNSYFSADTYASHGVALASARAGNVIGGGDWATDRLVPDVMMAFIDKRTVTLRNPKSIRPWQHVLEPLNGYLTLAERLWESGPAYAQAWNFGPDAKDIRPVSWIVQGLAERWGDSAHWEMDSGQHPHETRCLMLDCDKAMSMLNCRPKLSLETALDGVVEWYGAYRDNADMRHTTRSQIVRYQERT